MTLWATSLGSPHESQGCARGWVQGQERPPDGEMFAGLRLKKQSTGKCTFYHELRILEQAEVSETGPK